MTSDLSRARWFKSTYSESGGQCVEVAFLDGDAVGVRDSKKPDGGVLVFTAVQWRAFTARVRDGLI
ncbi:DUF397 domain-containing protein [Nocardia sp. NPDC020380]|uniref:DUF397 domain-containing protein n=1 Tax=Nocardia sp. NPDC020380 TaxID=3364309 RepID=UPI0037A893EB